MITKQIARTVFYPQLLLFCLLCWIIGSEAGLLTLYGLIKILLPGELQIEDIQGRLIQSFDLNNIQYKTDHYTFRAKKITLEGQFHTLLNNTFKFPVLLLEEASVQLQQSTIWIHKANLQLEGRLNGRMLYIELREFQGGYQDMPILAAGQLLLLDKKVVTADAQLHIGAYHLTLQTEHPQRIHWQAEHPSCQTAGFVAFSETGLHGEGKLIAPTKGFLIPLAKGAYHLLKIEHGFLTIDLTEQGLSSHFLVKENQHNYLEGDCAIANFTLSSLWQDAPLSGSFKGRMNDFKLIYRLTPFISRIKGSTDLQATLSGSVKQPQLILHLTLDQGEFSLPKQGISIHHLNSEITGALPGTLAMVTKGQIDASSFQLTGSFNPFSLDRTVHFDFFGQRLKLFNTANIYLIASPQVVLTYRDKRIHIDGEVTIPEAMITLADENRQIVYSQDVVVIEPDHSSTDSPVILPRLYFIIEDKVRFKGYGLDASMGGKLLIECRRDGLYTGMGRLTIKEGKYRLPGAMGYINHGRLLFPIGTLLYNPLLDIRITQKRVEQLDDHNEVGITVQGTLQKPSYQLYSDQPLQQSEILSRLGFGGMEHQNEQYSRQLLSQSAMLFNSTANPLFGQLQLKLGLEEIGIQSRRKFSTTTGDDSMLVLGKSLSKRFYLQFLQGMLDPISIVRLKYAITTQTAISVEKSNEGMGADLSFTIEKD